MVWKKVAVLLDFVQITSTPPPQNLDNLYHFFLTPTCQKFLAGVTVPLPPHPQIDPLYTVCEKLTKNLGRALPSPTRLLSNCVWSNLIRCILCIYQLRSSSSTYIIEKSFTDSHIAKLSPSFQSQLG